MPFPMRGSGSSECSDKVCWTSGTTPAGTVWTNSAKVPSQHTVWTHDRVASRIYGKTPPHQVNFGTNSSCDVTTVASRIADDLAELDDMMPEPATECKIAGCSQVLQADGSYRWCCPLCPFVLITNKDGEHFSDGIATSIGYELMMGFSSEWSNSYGAFCEYFFVLERNSLSLWRRAEAATKPLKRLSGTPSPSMRLMLLILCSKMSTSWPCRTSSNIMARSVPPLESPLHWLNTLQVSSPGHDLSPLLVWERLKTVRLWIRLVKPLRNERQSEKRQKTQTLMVVGMFDRVGFTLFT